MHVTIVVGQTSPQFLVLFSLFFKVVFPLSHACCLISVMLSNVKYPQPYYWVISILFSFT
jgi:presenilin-like A22 family membrane protease